MEIIRYVHSGIGNSDHSKGMASHRGKNSTYEKVAQKFFWYNTSNDISDFVKKCEHCQKQGDLKFPKVDLKPILIPSTMMNKVGVDICNLPETDGYCHKSAPTVAQFLYEVMCHHGGFDVQINDQGREFLNQVCDGLHKLT